MNLRKGSLLALLGAALAGCGAAPVDYASDLELSERPGMFSGEKGVFVIRPADSLKEAPRSAAAASANAGEHEEFLRWQKERSASEQRDFEDWREWREWKKRNR